MLHCKSYLTNPSWNVFTEVDDAIVAPDKVISVAELIEDELILAMPMIPRHEEGNALRQITSSKQIVLQEVQEVQEVQKYKSTNYLSTLSLIWRKTMDKQNT